MNSAGKTRWVIGLVLTMTLAAAFVLTPIPARAVPQGFVTRQGDQLLLGGSTYRFTGLNVYNANSTGNCGPDLASGSALDDAMDAMGPGVKVIRAWFFQSLATNGGVRDWTAFDHTLAVAAAHDVRVIPTLGNQWPDCEPAAGFKDDTWYSTGYTQTDPGGTVSYRDWVAEVVTRYRDDPTVLFWQLMNEAEVKSSISSGCDVSDAGQLLRDFATDASGLVNSIDANHLVSLGTIGSGQCGASGPEYEQLHAIPTIDLCEFHDYDPTTPIPGDQFNGMQVRIDQCATLDKPLFVGELGIRVEDAGGLDQRASILREKLQAQFGAGIVGILSWAWFGPGGVGTVGLDIGPGDPILQVLADAQANPGTTERVSVAFGGGFPNNSSFRPVLSADGRFVAFWSLASNFTDSADTSPNYYDIFVYDRFLDVTERVSRHSDGTPGNGNSGTPAISADGRFVAFSSDASNLVTNPPATAGIYVHDRQTGQTEFIASTGYPGASEGHSLRPSISADGRFVALLSNLRLAEPFSFQPSIFVYDRDTDTITNASVSSDGVPANQLSTFPSISDDGRYVAFESDATNLLDMPDTDTNGARDIFVHDLQIGTTVLASQNDQGGQAIEGSEGASLSGDGGSVAFWSRAENLAADGNGWADVFVRDLTLGTTTLVSQDGAPSDSDSFGPWIDADGSTVAFLSCATTLDPPDTNGFCDAYVKALPGGSVQRTSVSSLGDIADAESFHVSLSGNGNSVAFHTAASNLAGPDPHGIGDIFVHELGPGTAPVAPDAPTSVIAARGDESAAVSWTPGSDNGSPITKYTVTTSPADVLPVEVFQPDTSVVITGLTNGTSYTFTITATNAGGTSPPSAPSNAVVPNDPPDDAASLGQFEGDGTTPIDLAATTDGTAVSSRAP